MDCMFGHDHHFIFMGICVFFPVMYLWCWDFHGRWMTTSHMSYCWLLYTYTYIYIYINSPLRHYVSHYSYIKPTIHYIPMKCHEHFCSTRFAYNPAARHVHFWWGDVCIVNGSLDREVDGSSMQRIAKVNTWRIPSGNLTKSYGKWAVYSGFTHWKSWFSIVICSLKPLQRSFLIRASRWQHHDCTTDLRPMARVARHFSMDLALDLQSPRFSLEFGFENGLWNGHGNGGKCHWKQDHSHWNRMNIANLTGAERREWMGMGEWGLLGWLLLVIMDHSRTFPAFSTRRNEGYPHKIWPIIWY